MMLMLLSGRARVQAGGAFHHVHRRRRQARPGQAAHRQGLHGGPVQQDGEGGRCQGSVTELAEGEKESQAADGIVAAMCAILCGRFSVVWCRWGFPRDEGVEIGG